MTKDDNNYNKWLRNKSKKKTTDADDQEGGDSGIGTLSMAEDDVNESYLKILMNICGDLNIEDIRELLEQGKQLNEIIAESQKRRNNLVKVDFSKRQEKKQQVSSDYDGPDGPDNGPDAPDGSRPTDPKREGPEETFRPPYDPWKGGPKPR